MRLLKQLMLTLVVVCALGLVACSDDSNPPPINPDGIPADSGNMDAGTPDLAGGG